MKTIFKRIVSLMLVALMLASALALTSCDVINGIIGGGTQQGSGNNNNNNNNHNNNEPEEEDNLPGSFIMEAEYVDFTGLVGGGHSNEQYEEMMIYGNGSDEEIAMGWSNGYFVSATHKEGICLTFVFTSDREVSNATIVLRLGSEMGNLTFSPDEFEIKLNGEVIDYNPMYINNTPVLEEMKFVDKTITNTATLVEGENTLTLTVLANTLSGGTTAGPIIDCVKITSSANLDWNPLLDNPDKREEGI